VGDIDIWQPLLYVIINDVKLFFIATIHSVMLNIYSVKYTEALFIQHYNHSSSVGVTMPDICSCTLLMLVFTMPVMGRYSFLLIIIDTYNSCPLQLGGAIIPNKGECLMPQLNGSFVDYQEYYRIVSHY
jgi:hypothetical protein